MPSELAGPCDVARIGCVLVRVIRMIVMTWIDIAWGVFTLAASFGGSWFIARRAGQAERASGAHVTAVGSLLPSLAMLRALLHQSAVSIVRPEDVSSAITTFETLCMQHDAALPEGVRGLRREVRAAIGNYFGGASLAAVDAEMASYPLSEPDPYWRDVSISYVEYVMTALQLSVVRPKAPRMPAFFEWRRDEDQFHRELTRPAGPGPSELRPGPA